MKDCDPVQTTNGLSLSAQLGRKYPYEIPTMELRNVRGLSLPQQKQLRKIITANAQKLSTTGNVMMCELVQVVEDFLLEYNKDPVVEKMSAWEKMKAREAEEAKKKEERFLNMHLEDEEDEREMISGVEEGNSATDLYSMSTAQDSIKVGRIKQEIERQMEALGAAVGGRKMRGSSFLDEIRGGLDDHEENDDDFEEENDEDDYEDDPANTVFSGSSRYKTDFIELGLLGRGGGGEVVKVRNRLDRRLYAIKKIMLQSERGRSAKYGSIQNRKLRREVTTISRMTHKNIVRYYQAWVEGGIESMSKNNTNTDTAEKSSIELNDISEHSIHSSNPKLSTTSSDGDNSSGDEKNWWQKSPSKEESYSDWTNDDYEDQFSEASSGNIDSDKSDNGIDLSNPLQTIHKKQNAQKGKVTKASLVLENEGDHDFQVKDHIDFDLHKRNSYDCAIAYDLSSFFILLIFITIK